MSSPAEGFTHQTLAWLVIFLNIASAQQGNSPLVELTARVNALEAKLLERIEALEAENAAQQATIDALQANLAALQVLQDLAAYVSVDTSTLNGLAGPHFLITGANLHIRSGSGMTNDGGSPTGLGNLTLQRQLTEISPQTLALWLFMPFIIV